MVYGKGAVALNLGHGRAGALHNPDLLRAIVGAERAEAAAERAIARVSCAGSTSTSIRTAPQRQEAAIIAHPEPARTLPARPRPRHRIPATSALTLLPCHTPPPPTRPAAHAQKHLAVRPRCARAPGSPRHLLRAPPLCLKIPNTRLTAQPAGSARTLGVRVPWIGNGPWADRAAILPHDCLTFGTRVRDAVIDPA